MGGRVKRSQTFTSSGTFTPSTSLLASGGWVDITVVGGGGGGSLGNYLTPGSGGGGGEVVTTTASLTGNATVTVGSGGAGAAWVATTTLTGAMVAPSASVYTRATITVANGANIPNGASLNIGGREQVYVESGGGTVNLVVLRYYSSIITASYISHAVGETVYIYTPSPYAYLAPNVGSYYSLASAITASQLSLPVNQNFYNTTDAEGGAGLSTFYYVIDTELMSNSGVTGVSYGLGAGLRQNWSLSARGTAATTAAAHSSGANVIRIDSSFTYNGGAIYGNGAPYITVAISSTTTLLTGSMNYFDGATPLTFSSLNPGYFYIMIGNERASTGYNGTPGTAEIVFAASATTIIRGALGTTAAAQTAGTFLLPLSNYWSLLISGAQTGTGGLWPQTSPASAVNNFSGTGGGGTTVQSAVGVTTLNTTTDIAANFTTLNMSVGLRTTGSTNLNSTVTLTSGAGISAGSVLVMGSEQMLVTSAANSPSFTVTRAYNNTDSSYGIAQGSTVYYYNAGVIVDSTTIANNSIIQIDSEQMLVTAGGGTTSLTVIRGYKNTTIATHTAGAWVYLVYAAAAGGSGAQLDPANYGAKPYQINIGGRSASRTGSHAMNLAPALGYYYVGGAGAGAAESPVEGKINWVSSGNTAAAGVFGGLPIGGRGQNNLGGGGGGAFYVTGNYAGVSLPDGTEVPALHGGGAGAVINDYYYGGNTLGSYPTTVWADPANMLLGYSTGSITNVSTSVVIISDSTYWTQYRIAGQMSTTSYLLMDSEILNASGSTVPTVSTTGNTISPLIRGVSSTTAAAHAAGTPIWLVDAGPGPGQSYSNAGVRPATAGQANTGGGGGGGVFVQYSTLPVAIQNAGSGGSGVVIISWFE